MVRHMQGTWFRFWIVMVIGLSWLNAGLPLQASDPTPAQLLKNINQGRPGAALDQLTAVGTQVFFTADDGVQGNELWVSDGTEAGTKLVADLTPGTKGSRLSNFTAVGERLFFTRSSERIGEDGLWTSDGTAAGTLLLGNVGAYKLTAVGNQLFFIANQGLWRSDGTVAGTLLVRDFPFEQGFYSPQNLTAVGTTLFFSLRTTEHGSEVWKSDGTAAGTSLVKDVRPGSEGAIVSQSRFAAVGTMLFFSANDGVHGLELWKSDGSAAGTSLVKDLWPGSADGLNFASSLTGAGQRLFFIGHDGSTGWEVWTSDGTAAGTHVTKELRPGYDSASPRDLVAVGSRVFFISEALISSSMPEQWLWVSDGSEAGTMVVAYSPLADPLKGLSRFDELTAMGNWLFFIADDGDEGLELWKSDGTNATPILVKAIRPGPVGGIRPGVAGGTGTLVAAGSRLFVIGTDAMNGTQLWTSDGTTTGTQITRLLGPQDQDVGSFPSEGVTVGNKLFLVARDSTRAMAWQTGVTSERGLWVSDGTVAGTRFLAPVYKPDHLTAVGSTLFFAHDDELNGLALWKSDGTPEGTVRVKQIEMGSFMSTLRDLTAWGDTLFFIGRDGSGTRGDGLWTSDGTREGTVLVKEIWPGSASGWASDLKLAGEQLFFVGRDGAHGNELWVSDGTAAGTRMVTDLKVGSEDGLSNAHNLTVVGNRVFFVGDDGTSGHEIWTSDGTAAGTVLLKDLLPGTGSSWPKNLTAMGDKLFFTRSSNEARAELWLSDGTTTGTVMLKEITTTTGKVKLWHLTPAAQTLYFVVSDQTTGVYQTFVGGSLWASDGTSAGTRLVKAAEPDLASGNDDAFFAVGERLYFAAWTSDEGQELWTSDGTAAGTRLVQTINPGTSGSEPRFLGLLPNGLAFRADNGINGDELWLLRLGPSLASSNGSTGAPGSSFGFTAQGFAPGASVTVRLTPPVQGAGLRISTAGQVVGSIQADANGAVVFALRLAPNATVGVYTISASDGSQTATTQITVSADAPVLQAPTDVPILGAQQQVYLPLVRR